MAMNMYTAAKSLVIGEIPICAWRGLLCICLSLIHIYDLTPSQARILIYLSKVDHPVNQRELEKYFRLTNPTVTGLMQRMENKGFIRREMNQADNRSKYIILTPKAMEISNEVRNNLYKVEEDITQSLSQQECAQLRQLLQQVLEIMYRCPQ